MEGIELVNHSTGVSLRDVLHKKQKKEDASCETNDACLGSRMFPKLVSPEYTRTKEDIMEQAKKFLEEYYKSCGRQGSEKHRQRWTEVEQDIISQSRYTLTYDELTYGTRLAWRNAPRCIARMLWTNLKVFDARHVRTAKEMFECIIEHIAYATNGGLLRAAITVFPQRTDGMHDFRIWNSQLIGYAGYRAADGTVIGDPANVDITQHCIKLGWTPKRTNFDVLPLILQANGCAPEMFILPAELVLQVPIVHPEYDWFGALNLRWYALPAVANMLFDCGGLQFPAAPFNGWYMGTEIGSRDFCDVNRYNLTEVIARKMKLDTSSPRNLWKDTVVLETNKAVLYSFQKAGVTSWDHHTASESFMQFFVSETENRGGCPADWVWLVPPLSSSTSPLFHQEMAFYFLKPSFDYQVSPLKTYRETKKEREQQAFLGIKFKTVAKIVAVFVGLFKKRWLLRPKLSVLYASESGKAQKFAKEAHITMTSFFQAQILCLADIDVEDLWLYDAVLVIVSTFGDGEPPSNGVRFKEDILKQLSNYKRRNTNKKLIYSVLALGSNQYPKFCAFGKFVDDSLSKLGATSLQPLQCADEMKSQDAAFRVWLNETSSLLCGRMLNSGSSLPTADTPRVPATNFSIGRFVECSDNMQGIDALSALHQKKVSLVRVIQKTIVKKSSGENGTMILRLGTFGSEELTYEPGDHLAVFPSNPPRLVREIISRMNNCPQLNRFVQLETQHGFGSWEKQLPPVKFSTLLNRFVDLSGPPSQALIRLLASAAKDSRERNILLSYIETSEKYDNWVREYRVNVVDILNAFLSIDIEAADLIAALPILKPRFYSISSSELASPSQIYITASLVSYKINGYTKRQGLCSSYLDEVKLGDFIPCYVRNCPSFHLPLNTAIPIICIGAGSGIAPFRSFWWQRYHESAADKENIMEGRSKKNDRFWKIRRTKSTTVRSFGPMCLVYGCRTEMEFVYANEITTMEEFGIIQNKFIVFSREPQKPKSYVQDALKQNSGLIYKQITNCGAYVFVCGGSRMAADVDAALIEVIAKHGSMKQKEAAAFLENMKVYLLPITNAYLLRRTFAPRLRVDFAETCTETDITVSNVLNKLNSVGSLFALFCATK